MTTPAADPMTLLRSRKYLILLTIAVILGVFVSAAAYGFLALVAYLQKELFVHLPHGIGYASAPLWWPVIVLAVGGILTGLAIRFLPGDGGASPAYGFKLHPPRAPAQLPGVVLAALATLSFGAVLGPEMPLIALGGGLAILAARASKKPLPQQSVTVLASAGSFAAISALFGSPILGAFLLMESSGLGGPMLGVVLAPGLLASGIGFLIFIGLNAWTGLGKFSLSITGLPHIGAPTIGEFGWAIVIGLAAVALGTGIHRLGLLLRGYSVPRTLLALPVAGLAVGGLAVAYHAGTGKDATEVLFSGQNSVGPLILHNGSYPGAALILLVACKGLAYGVSLSSFRGGPVFPSLFIGAALGLAFSHLPGLNPIAGAATGIGAMCTIMLSLPLTSVLLASLLMGSDGVQTMPLVIVAVVVAYVGHAWFTGSSKPSSATSPAPEQAGVTAPQARR